MICEITIEWLIELSFDLGSELENDLKLIREKWGIHRMVDDPDGSYSTLITYQIVHGILYQLLI